MNGYRVLIVAEVAVWRESLQGIRGTVASGGLVWFCGLGGSEW